MGTFRIVRGRVEDVLPTLEGPFDAVLSDPPYGFNFMGAAWDHGVPAASTWALVLDLLRPGALLLAFGGPRTFHRLAVAIEDAGFEIRDTLCWLFGQGFPKSMDVSKAIDKAAGEEREVVDAEQQQQTDARITAPASELAARFEGYGTAIKPAWEPVVLAMKPNAGSYADNARIHGVAGLNVDGTRIASGPSPSVERRETSTAPNSQRNRGVKGGLWRPGGDGEVSKVHRPAEELGRFPANVMLTHQPGCRQVGDRSVRSGTAVLRNVVGKDKATGATSILGGMVEQRGGEHGYAENGREVVPAWQCEPGCPVAQLDQQSGESTTPTQVVQGRSGTGNAYSIGTSPGAADMKRLVACHGDTGGASRFFYTGKATATERAIGQVRNQHPTVKPVDLCAWLAKMILPPPRLDGAPRRLLVPFSGSGSEVLAALRAGWDEVVGVEMDERWVEVSRQRIKGDAPLFTVEDAASRGVGSTDNPEEDDRPCYDPASCP